MTVPQDVPSMTDTFRRIRTMFDQPRRGQPPGRPSAKRKIASPGGKLSEKRSQRTVFLTEEECGR